MLRHRFFWGIRTKIGISFVAVIIISVSILAYQCYVQSRQLIDNQTKQYISDMLNQTGKNVEMHLDAIADLVFNIQINSAVQRHLAEANSTRWDSYERYARQRETTDFLYRQIIYNDLIESAVLVSESGLESAANKSTAQYVMKVDKAEIYEGLGGAVWFRTDAERRYMPIAAQVNSLITQKPLGYLVLNVREEYIHKIFSYMEFVRNGQIMIVDEELHIISTPQSEMLDTTLDSRYEYIVQSGADSGFYIDTDENGNEQYVAFRTLGETNWRLLAFIPVVSYSQTLMALRQSVLLISLTVIIVMAVIAFLLTGSFSRPIKKLAGAMQRFGHGDFDVTCDVHTDDEVGILSDSFNGMVYNINDLIEKVYHETLLKQQAELTSLRMQINPHFLYNTLETINWMSRIKGVPDIGVVAKALGDMMRTTISGSDFVTIKEELKNIRNYLQIQCFRCGDKLNTTISVCEEMHEMYIPKLILQPLIENAIVHGIEERPTPGHIDITGMLENDNVVFLIRDDGVGIPENLVASLLEDNYDLVSEQYTSIGLRNVDKRLKLYYGAQYGIHIESVVGEGTTIRITFPGRTEP